MNLHTTTTSPLATDQYINSNQVRARYGGVSPSWIFRKTHEEGFPQPASRFGGRRRYWLLSDLIEWEMGKIKATENQRHQPVTVVKSKTLN